MFVTQTINVNYFMNETIKFEFRMNKNLILTNLNKQYIFQKSGIYEKNIIY